MKLGDCRRGETTRSVNSMLMRNSAVAPSVAALITPYLAGQGFAGLGFARRRAADETHTIGAKALFNLAIRLRVLRLLRRPAQSHRNAR